MLGKFVTVVETKAFSHRAASRMTPEEVAGLINRLAADPFCGTALGGNLYKVRVGHGARGKSGGVRVIYLFASEVIPVFLLTVFAKNEQANISAAERAALIELGDAIAARYGE